MSADRIAKGRLAEAAVARYLQEKGYLICDINYLVPRLGELDLVVKRDNQLTVVEVKARSHTDIFGGLPSAITPAKLRRLRNTAWCYLKEKQLMNYDVAFLAALVEIDTHGKVLSIDTAPIENL